MSNGKFEPRQRTVEKSARIKCHLDIVSLLLNTDLKKKVISLRSILFCQISFATKCKHPVASCRCMAATKQALSTDITHKHVMSLAQANHKCNDTISAQIWAELVLWLAERNSDESVG